MNRIMTTWSLLGALIASAALNVYHTRGTPAESETPLVFTDSPCPTEGPPCCPLVVKLELTPQQREEFADCCPKYLQRSAELDARIDTLVAELETALGSEPLETGRIQALVERIGQARAEQLTARIQSIVLVRKTLTRTQLEQLMTAVDTDSSTRPTIP